ncbi:MAG: sarcosine oxidase subunit gamma, partial [Paracoccaceae bacterium]|nr:sarcosine oxidase subunit gamma [Paracoccaceae bacterium]
MPSLIAKSPLAGQAPAMIGAGRLAEAACGPITSVAPFKGQEKPLAKALMALGLAFPVPNSFVRSG